MKFRWFFVIIFCYFQGFSQNFKIEKDLSDTLPTKINFWELRKDGSISPLGSPVDTSLFAFQRYLPMEKKCFFYSFLGNFGQPIVANDFYLQRKLADKEFFLKNSFQIYLQNNEKAKFFHTNKPFAEIFYTSGMQQTDEQTLKVLVSQNIKPFWNAGFRYELIDSKGEFPNQETKMYVFSLFSSVQKNRYSLHGVFNYNSIRNFENGGIPDSISKQNEFISSKFENIKTNFHQKDAILQQEYRFGRRTNIANDSVSPQKKIIGGFLGHKLTYETDAKIYIEEKLPAKFYRNIFRDSSKTYDSLYFRKLRNTLYFRTEIENFGFYVGISNELNKIFNEKDSVSELSHFFSNNSVNILIFNRLSKKFQYEVDAEYFFNGFRKNDILTSANLKRFLFFQTDTVYLSLNVDFQRVAPQYFENKLFSNHFFWEKNFEAKTETAVRFSFVKPHWNLEIGASSQFLQNYFYFDKNFAPQQCSKLNVFSIFLNKKFFWKRFWIQTNLIYQTFSEKLFSEIYPDFAGYLSFGYKNSFLKNVFNLQLGSEISYQNEFFAQNYNPALSEFYPQYSVKIKNYPMANLFINMHIKSAVLFFKWENVVSLLNENLYFSTFRYPVQNFVFKFGIIWRFYN